MTTPVGYPAWSRTATFEQYGGHESKRNYLSEGVVNAATDVSAEQFCRLSEDLAEAVRAAPFAVLQFTARDATSQDPTVNHAFLMTATTSASYDGGSPPLGFPSVTRTSDGVYLVTFGTSYSDEFGVSADITIRTILCTVNSATYGYATGIANSANTLTVSAWDSVGAALPDETITIVVHC